MKTMSLNEFAEIINAADNWKTEFNQIIKDNGWKDYTGTETGICESQTEVLEFNEDGKAIVRSKKRYAVQYCNRVESNTEESFDTLDEAIKYADSRVKGCELATGDVYSDQAMAFRYEIFDMDNFDIEVSEPIYSTPFYWAE